MFVTVAIPFVKDSAGHDIGKLQNFPLSARVSLPYYSKVLQSIIPCGFFKIDFTSGITIPAFSLSINDDEPVFEGLMGNSDDYVGYIPFSDLAIPVGVKLPPGSTVTVSLLNPTNPVEWVKSHVNLLLSYED